MPNSVKIETASPTAIAQEFSERIRQAPDWASKLTVREEWCSAYANFTPEQKAELEPHFAKLGESIDRRFAEMDALIADFKQKHPSLTHLFDEK